MHHSIHNIFIRLLLLFFFIHPQHKTKLNCLEKFFEKLWGSFFFLLCVHLFVCIRLVLFKFVFGPKKDVHISGYLPLQSLSHSFLHSIPITSLVEVKNAVKFCLLISVSDLIFIKQCSFILVLFFCFLFDNHLLIYFILDFFFLSSFFRSYSFRVLFPIRNMGQSYRTVAFAFSLRHHVLPPLVLLSSFGFLFVSFIA